MTTQLQQATEVLGARYPAEVVVPNSQLQVISALQGGLVEALMVAEGDHVSKDQPLARLQSPGLLELQRDLLQTLIQLNLAQSTLNRNKQLLDEGIIPKRRYLESRSVWQALVTQKEQHEAMLLFSGMSSPAITELEKNRKLNSALTVTAPFDGVLLEQMAIPGQKLEAADPLFKIGRLSPLWLEIHMPVDVVSGIVIGDTVSVPEMNIEGEVITIGRMVHAADQGTLVRAIIRDNIEQLRPGQVVQARVAQKYDEQKRYLVPRRAIIRLDQKTIIFIEVKQGFEAIHVDVVGSREGQQIITSNQPITVPVVTSGTVTLKAILTGAGGEG
jgi:RND family efflux transporter MFP subunit